MKTFKINRNSSLLISLILSIVLVQITSCESSPPNYNALLLEYARTGSLSGVRRALEQGKARINYRDGNGFTALIWASREGKRSIVRYLVEQGADVNIRTQGGDTAILWAAFRNYSDIVAYLADNGANVNARNSGGKSALNFAYDAGEIDLYNYLKVKYGAIEFEPQKAAQQSAAPQANDYAQSAAPAQSAQRPSAAQNIQQSAQQLNQQLQGSLENGTYKMSGRPEEIAFAGIANTGSLFYKDASGNSTSGTYTISGDRITMNILGRTFFYTITSRTSFSGNGETWMHRGY